LSVDDPDVVWRQLSMLMNGYRDDNHRNFAAEVRTRNLESRPSGLLKFADNRQHLPNC
jgi:hypothetical protein